MPSDCIFCEIAAGREPASFVYRDADVLAFMSIAPVNPGHLLVIPHRHAPSLSELLPELASALFLEARRFGAALRSSSLRCEGVNLFLADGAAASQLVPHVHLHVIPRFTGDSFKLNSRGGVTAPDNRSLRKDLDAAAAAIRAALAA